LVETEDAALTFKKHGSVAVKELRQELGLNRKQFDRLTAASERAVADWENDQPISPGNRKSLRESERLCQALMKIMRPGNVGEWLDTPNEAFSGPKPLDPFGAESARLRREACKPLPFFQKGSRQSAPSHSWE
jgi:hypothetical protein